jgi:hypothetical protein
MQFELLSSTLAKSGLAGSLEALLIQTSPQAIEETNGSLNNSVYEVTGHVRSFRAYPDGTLEHASGAVVWLVPAQTGRMVRLNTELVYYRMMQRNRTFEPHLLVVPVRSIVEFPNHEPWFLNVFSAFANGGFDLGVYEGGAQRAARFDHPGVSYLFCSLHTEMTAIVLTVDSTYFAVSEKTGNISIGTVPPGKYFLHFWYENAASQVLEAPRGTIFVGGDRRNLPTILIVLPKAIPMTSKKLNADQSTFVGANWGRP